jgi:type 2 lantibiotic biosynthesis protein LanM
MSKSSSPARVPDWQEILSAARLSQTVDDEVHPFASLVQPFVTYARNSVAGTVDGGPFPPEAVEEFSRQLTTALLNVITRVVSLEFEVFRATQLSALLRRSSTLRRSSVLYKQFVSAPLQRARSVLRKYPVAGELLAAVTKGRAAAFNELALRYEADRHLLSGSLLDGKNQILTRVVSLQSDPHSGGRTVFALHFQDGAIVYKPRPLDLHYAVHRFSTWLADEGAPYAPVFPKVCLAGDYGWSEFIAPTMRGTDADAREYYLATGALAAFAHVLNGEDIHYENLVAGFPRPIIVDVETFATPALSRAVSDEFSSFENSVLRTGLLPRWQFGPMGDPYDVSGLGRVEDQETSFLEPTWRNPKTDATRLVSRRIWLGEGLNVLKINGCVADPSDYVEEIARGFHDLYAFVLSRRASLLDPGGPLKFFRRARVRIVARPTQAYRRTMERLLEPDALRSDYAFRRIASHSLDSLTDPRCASVRALIPDEIQQLSAGDVPIFSALTTARTMPNGFRLAMSGYQGLRSKLQSLSSADLNWQLSVVRGALATRRTLVSEPHNRNSSPVALSLESCAQWASDSICRQICPTRDLLRLDYEWLGPSERLQLQPLTLSLYNGLMGIGLFMKAASHRFPSEKYLAAVDLIARDLKRAFEGRSCARALVQQYGIGGCFGVGSIVYGAAYCFRIDADERFRRLVRQSAECLTRKAIDEDQHFDVTMGAAGAALGLVAAYDVTADARLLDQAMYCGKHLLRHRLKGGRSKGLWKSKLSNQALCGFAHGASGISYALQRLYSATGYQPFLEASSDAIRLEDALYDFRRGNWPDLRTGATPEEAGLASWCTGRTGIALARLGCLPSASSSATVRSQLRQDFQCSNSHVDTLCCGVLGDVEYLVYASQVARAHNIRGFDSFQRSGAKLFRNVVSGAADRGHYRGVGNRSGLHALGLFKGISGIGLTALRVEDPDALPSVLLFM